METTYEYYEVNTGSPSEFAGELKKISYTVSTTSVEFKYNRFGALSWVEVDEGIRTFTYHDDLQLNQGNAKKKAKG